MKVLAFLVSGLLFAPMGVSSAQARSSTGLAAACAAYDLNAVMQIEEYGDMGDADVPSLMQVVDALLRAREACRLARFDALSLYERIEVPVAARPLR